MISLSGHSSSLSEGTLAAANDDPFGPIEAHFPKALLFRLASDGRILQLNARAADFLPVAPAHGFVGQCLIDYIRKDERAAFAAAVNAVADRTHSDRDVAGGVRDDDGSVRHFRGALTPGPSGAPGDVILAAHEITSPREEGERLSEIVEGSAEGIVVHRGGEILYANTRMAEMLSLDDPDELVNLASIEQFVHPEDHERVFANMRASLAGLQTPRDYEFRLLAVTGETVSVNCRANTVIWNGEPAIVTACFDITEQKRAEQERAETERLFRKIFELAPEMLTLTRAADGRFEFVNPAVTSLMGYNPDELIGKTSEELGVWTASTTRSEILKVLRENEVVHNFVAELRCADGSTMDASFSASLLEYRGETYILMIAHDITERMRQRQELIESKRAAELANRSKSEFLANISHELRTPLNAVIGFAELLHTEALGPHSNPQYCDYARDILEAGRHLLSLINDILDLSKLEAGRLTADTESCDVGELLSASQRLVAERASDAGLLLEVETPEDGLEIDADPRRMKQILINLLSNAVKFTPEGGRVQMSAQAEGDWVRFSVSDTGIGMSPEDLEKARTPFEQVDSALSRRHEGAGLGLPIVQALVDLQSGCFEIESESGAGTTARVYMPQPAQRSARADGSSDNA